MTSPADEDKAGATPPPSTPAFGEADLSNCEREQIHLAGSIQPHGALLVLREPDHVVVQASANAAAVLGLPGPLLGRRLADLASSFFAIIREQLNDTQLNLPRAVRCHIGTPPRSFDAVLHRPPGGGLIIEFEQAGGSVDLARHVDTGIQAVLSAASMRLLADETARIFRDLTGYDRVMVYRFDDEGHGEVYAELRRPDLEAFLGNRYPASDIPQIARRLYVRNRVRVLVDITYTPVPLEPRLSPISGEELDMSLCILRSISPIHVQYLKNMGVGATLVVSLVVGGKLWGLVSCHHYSPRFIHFETRAVCELLAEAVATRILALESYQQGQADIHVRRLEQRLVETISRDGDWRAALFDSAQSLLKPLDANGVALLFEGQVLTAGEVPATQDLRDIGSWLDGRQQAPVIATASLTLDVPEFDHLAPVVAGLVATRLSRSPGEYIVWFRHEQIRTVTWGGDPFKPALVGDDPTTLSPRRSFAQWHQQVERTCEPWSRAELTAARLIGETVADVVLQFRALRVLVAQDQLDRIRNQVRDSDQPVLIADPAGRVLLTNEAFQRLLSHAAGRPAPAPQALDDLATLFEPQASVAARLRDLVAGRQTWRGEARLRRGEADAVPLLVRADPVFSAPGHVLGFVLMFTDLTERKAVEAARQRFQRGILEGHDLVERRLDTRADRVFRSLLSPVVENAQLAALEITDGADMTGMPELLDSVRDSVARTAEVLQHLIRHATATPDGEDG